MEDYSYMAPLPADRLSTMVPSENRRRKWGSFGNTVMDAHTTRRRVNDAFLRDLLADWQQYGAEVIRQAARESPGTYLKVMAMLMPKEMKVETTHATISSLTYEELQAMVHELQERIASKLSGEDAKVINGKTEQPQALPKPEKPWRPRRTRKAAKALKAIAADCETNDQSAPSPGEEPLK